MPDAASRIGVPRETYPGERRVALTPGTVPTLARAGLSVCIEGGAGVEAGYPDEAYREKGASIVTHEEALACPTVLRVRACEAATDEGRSDLALLGEDRVVIGFAQPLAAPDALRQAAEAGVSVFAMELVPRITRAQSMDALSSQANIAGYKAVLLAAAALPKMFPMLTTAAGTIAPARVFVVGAGVAGLQAIATARRLGAVVEAYDVRPVVKEQVESVGGKFVELELETGQAEDTGGYAKDLGDDFYRRQQAMMTRVVAASDAVITTAQVPGKRAPVLVTKDMVEGMERGSVVVDLAAEQGGNCELSRPDETILWNGVSILGPTNLPATVAHHASQVYAKNVSTFLLHLVRDGRLHIDTDDEIVRETLVSRGGRVVHQRVREAFGLAPATQTAAQ